MSPAARNAGRLDAACDTGNMEGHSRGAADKRMGSGRSVHDWRRSDLCGVALSVSAESHVTSRVDASHCAGSLAADMSIGLIGGPTLPETCGHDWHYFQSRECIIDCRGPLIIDGTSVWGYKIQVYTQSHSVVKGPEQFGFKVEYPVTVKADAWICSGALLTGCTIGEGAVVAAGTVVRAQTVAPGVMVAGNPARVVARWDGTRWVYVDYKRVLD